MTDWSVLVEVVGGSNPTEEAIDAFVDLMVEHHGSVGIAQDRPRYSARLSVEADDAADATSRAIDAFRAAAAAAGLSDAPIVRVEAMTHDELDRELAQPARR